MVVFLEVTPGFELKWACKMLFQGLSKTKYFQWLPGFTVKCCIMLKKLKGVNEGVEIYPVYGNCVMQNLPIVKICDILFVALL